MLYTALWPTICKNYILIALKLRPSRSKMCKIFLRNKKTRADLNFWAIDPKFLYVLNSFMAYNLINSTKIEAWATLYSLISKPLKIGFCHVRYHCIFASSATWWRRGPTGSWRTCWRPAWLPPSGPNTSHESSWASGQPWKRTAAYLQRSWTTAPSPPSPPSLPPTRSCRSKKSWTPSGQRSSP